MASQKDKNRLFSDAVISHQMYLQRLAESYGNKIVHIVTSSEGDLMKFLETRLTRFGAVRPDLKTNAKFTKIHAGVSEIRRPAIIQARAYVTEELTVLAENEAVFAEKSVDTLLKDISLKAVPSVILNQIVKQGIFSGATIKSWFNDLADNDITRIMNHVRTGMTQGLTTNQIVRGLRGTAKANYTDGLLNLTNTHARTITRTCTNGVANSAKMALYSKNADIITGFRYSAMLDGRTSEVCAALDGTVWQNPEEAAEVKTPPLHHNCRSSIVPEVTGFSKMKYDRPSADSNFVIDAEKRYNSKMQTKGLSRRWGDLAQSTKDKYYYGEIKTYEKQIGRAHV